VGQAAQALAEEGRGVEALDFVLSALAAVLSKSRELELQVAKLLREGAGSRSWPTRRAWTPKPGPARLPSRWPVWPKPIPPPGLVGRLPKKS
jgi:hypothetical protein